MSYVSITYTLNREYPSVVSKCDQSLRKVKENPAGHDFGPTILSKSATCFAAASLTFRE